MRDPGEKKSLTYSRERNKIRTVTATKWELPIPSSKKYWDAVFEDLERRGKRSSDPLSNIRSYHPEPTDESDFTSNYRDSASSRSSFVVEPIVKISPPTPLRRASGTVSNFPIHDVIDEIRPLDTNFESESNDSSIDSAKRIDNVMSKSKIKTENSIPDLTRNVRSIISNEGTEKRTGNERKYKFPEESAKVFEIPAKITEFVERGEMKTKKSCQIHQNAPPLRIFDDDLKRFLPKTHSPKKTDVGTKLKDEAKKKLHSRQSCPLIDRSATIASNKIDDDTTKNKTRGRLSRTTSAGPICKDEKNHTQELFKHFSTNSRDPITEGPKKRVRSKILHENLNEMFQINKLDEAEADTFFHRSSATKENLILPEIKLPTFTDEPSDNEPPKLGPQKFHTISAHSTFCKITPTESVDTDDENLRKYSEDSTNIRKSDNLKIPKLGMLSSYSSFNSLVSESLDAEESSTDISNYTSLKNTTSHDIPLIKIPSRTDLFQSLCSDQEVLENKEAKAQQSQNKSQEEGRLSNDEKYIERENVEDLNDVGEKLSPSVHFAEDNRPNRRRSLKDSVRYAYRALKFLTLNKTLDFEPKTYHPPVKTSSTSNSSGSSRRSKRSRIEPAIKLLTYQDVVTGRKPPKRDSESSSSYATLRSRLKERASYLMSPNDAFSNCQPIPRSTSATITSLKRSTSGDTLDLKLPLTSKPSNEILKIIPQMKIYPRRKYDKCFKCLHEAFKSPIETKHELPLATLHHASKRSLTTISDSDSSSVSLPDLNDLAAAHLRNEVTTKIPFKQDSIVVSSKNFLGSGDESGSLSSLNSDQTHQKLTTPKDLRSPNSIGKLTSLSTELSKPSSQSGNTSSDSEDPQLQMDQNTGSSKYFVPCHAPLVWCQNLEPLRALKFKKPVSMQSRIASVSKSEDEDESDESAEEVRSTRVEPKSRRKSVRQKEPEEEESGNDFVAEVSPVGDKRMRRRPSAANLLKKQSTLNLLAHVQESVILNEEKSGAEEARPTEGLISRQGTQDHARKDVVLDGIPEVEDSGQSEDLVLSSKESMIVQTRGLQLTEEKGGRDEASSIPAKVSEDEKETAKHLQRLEIRQRIVAEERLMESLKKCIAKGFQPLEILETISADAIDAGSFACSDSTNPEVAQSAEIAKNLTKLLVESKKYLDTDTFSPNLEFSSPQPSLRNSRQLRRILPQNTYNLVAPILGMPKYYGKKTEDVQKPLDKIHSLGSVEFTPQKKDSYTSDDMIVHPPSARILRFPDADIKGYEEPTKSPYALFMEKPRRKVVTWRPLNEQDLVGYDPEATLNMRATRVTNKICKDFCDWLRSLGGEEGNIDEEVLKDMFEVDFTAEACRTMEFLVKEMPMVPTPVALGRNCPGAGELALTRRHLIRDAKAERRAKRTVGFGSNLPLKDRYIPPRNRVQEKWLRCENVPRDLETMEAVWSGITRLDSVKGFLTWLKAHPEVKPPKILMEASLMKEVLPRQLSTEEGLDNVSQLQSIGVSQPENLDPTVRQSSEREQLQKLSNGNV